MKRARPPASTIEILPGAGPSRATPCPVCGRALVQGRCAACRVEATWRTNAAAKSPGAARIISCALAAAIGASLWSFWLLYDADMLSGEALAYDGGFRIFLLQVVLFVAWFRLEPAIGRMRPWRVLLAGVIAIGVSTLLATALWEKFYWLW